MCRIKNVPTSVASMEANLKRRSFTYKVHRNFAHEIKRLKILNIISDVSFLPILIKSLEPYL